MANVYLGKWRREFPSEAAIEQWRRTWTDAFIEEGITLEEVRVGIATCRKTLEWVPTLPEFLRACRPSIDPEVAFREAVEQMAIRHSGLRKNGRLVQRDRWSDPAIYWAAVAMGEDLRSMPYAQIRKRWERELAKAKAEKRGPVPEVMDALPPPPKNMLSPEEASARIRGMIRDILGGNPAEGECR